MLRLKFGLLILSFLISFDSAAESVELRIHGLRSGKGYLALNVFSEDAKSSFPDKDQGAVRSFYLPLEGKTEIELELTDLKPGTYAIAMMHDEDGDKKFKTGWFGIPKEGFGFSNNPTIIFGPPSFEKAGFDFGSHNKLEIRMKYF